MFNGFDLFNRIVDRRWETESGKQEKGIVMSDLDRYQYGYDQNSNRLYKANVVGTPLVTGGLDECYSYTAMTT